MSYRKCKREERDRNLSELKDLSADWTEDRKDVARHTAWTLHKELYKIKGPYQDVKSTFFKGYSPDEEEANASTSTTIMKSQDRMHTVDSVASSHVMGLTSLVRKDEKTIRKKKQRTGWNCKIVRSTTEAETYIQELGTHVLREFGGRFSFGIVVGSAMR